MRRVGFVFIHPGFPVRRISVAEENIRILYSRIVDLRGIEERPLGFVWIVGARRQSGLLLRSERLADLGEGGGVEVRHLAVQFAIAFERAITLSLSARAARELAEFGGDGSARGDDFRQILALEVDDVGDVLALGVVESVKEGFPESPVRVVLME